MRVNWEFFNTRGWVAFERDEEMLSWIASARESVKKKLTSNAFNNEQFRCGGTWFIGVNFLENDSFGTVNNILFKGLAVEAIRNRYKNSFSAWDKAQVSICYEGYPRRNGSETLPSFEYRKKRYGAHVDGILPIGKAKRRYAREYHAFIFGIPLENCTELASPMVVWEGSHNIIRDYISKLLLEVPLQSWENLDLTKAYKMARREIFSRCRRKIIFVPLGGSYILHRLTLHGIMPWQETKKFNNIGRMIAYFRPTLTEPRFWLNENF